MEQEIDKNFENKNKFFSILKENKIKLISVLFIALALSSSFIFYKMNDNKKNILISEKYIQAGLLLTANENEKSKKLLEDIILSKHKFYSVLALNTILEKNLEKNENKVLNYFEVVKNLSLRQEQRDLVILKKALFLIKISKIDEGKKLLKKLIEGESKFKSLSEEILNS
tara:strand:- start:7318 stop:7827 length:510 start_codon:yes stop_codon:yes gene_type:complete